MLLTRYLAYLSFWSLGFYFLTSSTHTFIFFFHERTWLEKWPRFLRVAHGIHYSTVTSFPFLVTIIFWGTMNSGWPAGRFEQWANISFHGLNSVFATAEVVLPQTKPLPFIHMVILLGILLVYLGLAYLTHYTQGWYVYEWLNPAHGSTSIILHVLGYAGAMVIIFCIVHCVILGREKMEAWFNSRK